MELLFRYLPTLPPIYLLVLISVLLMNIVYRYAENKWPEVYFSLSDKASIFITLNPIRFFLFRFFPVFSTSLVVLSIVKEDYFTLENRIAIGFLIGVIHASRTDLLAIFKLLKNSKSIRLYVNKWGQVLVHIVSTFLVIFLSTLAGFVSSLGYAQKITPTWQGVIDNLWSSIITAGFIFAFYNLYHNLGSKMASIDIYQVSQKSISPSIIQEIERQSAIYNADEYLARAICIVENLQRPFWMRTLERVKSFFLPRGTYGIMQVSSDKYVSDKESISIAIRDYLQNTVGLDDEQRSVIIKKYSSDGRYEGMILEVYRSISPPTQ